MRERRKMGGIYLGQKRKKQETLSTGDWMEGFFVFFFFNAEET